VIDDRQRGMSVADQTSSAPTLGLHDFRFTPEQAHAFAAYRAAGRRLDAAEASCRAARLSADAARDLAVQLDHERVRAAEAAHEADRALRRALAGS
jgi:hypothetical protein